MRASLKSRHWMDLVVCVLATGNLYAFLLSPLWELLPVSVFAWWCWFRLVPVLVICGSDHFPLSPMSCKENCFKVAAYPAEVRWAADHCWSSWTFFLCLCFFNFLPYLLFGNFPYDSLMQFARLILQIMQLMPEVWFLLGGCPVIRIWIR